MLPYCDFTSTEDLCKESLNLDKAGVNGESPVFYEIVFSSKYHSYTQPW